MTMLFTKPLPFKEALNASKVKVLLPTSLGSADLAKLDADIRERSRFSAKVRSAQHLSILDDGVNDIVAGQLDLATARLKLKQFVRSTGYVPPEHLKGTLQDFSSDVRTNLQLRLPVQMAQGYGNWKQGQDSDLLDAFPARELLRVEDRVSPRDWYQRWDDARKATVSDGATASSSGRMVALVGHPIWVALSIFKQPYEPFDWGSGMGTEDVSRKEAMGLKIIGRDTQIFPQDRPFNQDLQTTTEFRSDKIRSLLEASGVGHFNAQGVFVHNGTN